MAQQLTAELTAEQVEELKKVFGKFDRSGNGFICTRELGAAMMEKGVCLREAQLQEMIRQIDADGKGTIDFSEFLTVMKRIKMVNDVFLMADKDGSGYITKDELSETMKTHGMGMTGDAIEDLIGKADLTADGKISFEELLNMLM